MRVKCIFQVFADPAESAELTGACPRLDERPTAGCPLGSRHGGHPADRIAARRPRPQAVQGSFRRLEPDQASDRRSGERPGGVAGVELLAKCEGRLQPRVHLLGGAGQARRDPVALRRDLGGSGAPARAARTFVHGGATGGPDGPVHPPPVGPPQEIRSEHPTHDGVRAAPGGSPWKA